MNVLITGTNFQNKGAELMMHAIVDELRKWPEVKDIVMPLESGSFKQRTASGVRHLLGRKVDRAPVIESVVARVGDAVPNWITRHSSFSRVRDLDLVLDASGYIYSDVSGPTPSRRSFRTHRRYAHGGAKVVLLPQAFGPFEDTQVRTAFQGVLRASTLAFARDAESLTFLRGIAPRSLKLASAPDFTIPSRATGDPRLIERYRGRACMVPNIRMLRDTDEATGAWYLDALTRAAQHLAFLGLEPYFLLHQDQDVTVAERIRARSTVSIEVVTHPDPRVLKGLLGCAHLAIASRYHALVGALASGVPAIGIGWSHKYRALFSDFDVPELSVPNGYAPQSILVLISGIVGAVEHAAFERRLRRRSQTLTVKVADMWKRVRDEVGAS